MQTGSHVLVPLGPPGVLPVRTGLGLVPESRDRTTDRTVARRCDFYVAVYRSWCRGIAIGDGPDGSATLCFTLRLEDDIVSVSAAACSAK